MAGENVWQQVEETVAEASQYGTVGVSLIGPDGNTWQHHGDRIFNAASTFKIAVMVTIYRQIDAGTLHLDDRYTLTDADRTGGSGVLNHMQTGANISLQDLIYLMISISDNLATDVLTEKAGIAAINETMADLGMKNSRIDRTIREFFALMKPLSGPMPVMRATPNDYAGAVRAILDNEAASADSCAAMAEMLTTQQNRRRLARYLTPNAPVQYGSKTGTLAGVCNDVGYIRGDNGRLIMAVYTENFPDSHVAEETIGEIARAAMADTGVAAPIYTS